MTMSSTVFLIDCKTSSLLSFFSIQKCWFHLLHFMTSLHIDDIWLIIIEISSGFIFNYTRDVISWWKCRSKFKFLTGSLSICFIYHLLDWHIESGVWSKLGLQKHFEINHVIGFRSSSYFLFLLGLNYFFIFRCLLL